MFAAALPHSASRDIKVPIRGEKNKSFGVYSTDCCGLEIVISVGSVFPLCPNHPNQITVWNAIDVDIARVVSTKKSKAEPDA
jgi:hypothetical protein